MLKRLSVLGRTAKAHAVHFRKRHRPIAIFGLRRGGSTIIADMVAENRGVWLANEPFAVLPAHPAYELKRQHLPDRRHSHYFQLNMEEEQKVRAYTDLLLRAALPQLGTCRHTKFPLVADRVCLKILNAPWLIDWFEAETDCHVLPLMRHPGAQAMSVMRQNWQFPLEAYADRLGDSGPELTPKQHSAIRDALSSADIWATAILDYAVVTKVMRKKFDDDLVYYENIIMDPASFVDRTLVDRFGLSDRDRILSRIQRPSGSSRMSLKSTNDAIASGDVRSILNAWRRDVSPEMLQSGQAILDLFEIDQYSFTRPDFTS